MSVQLSESDLAQLNTDLTRAFQRSRQQASEHLEQIKGYRDLYNGILPPKPEPWMANVHIPQLENFINTASTKIAAQAVGDSPIFTAEADDADSEQYVQGVEQFMQANIERMRFKTTATMGIRESMLTGQAWLPDGVKAMGKTLPQLPTGNLQGISSMPPSPLSLDELDWKPDCTLVITEDMMLIPYTAPSFERARGAFRRTTVTWSEIKNNKQIIESARDQLKGLWAQSEGVSPGQEALGITEWEPSELWDAEFNCYEGFFTWKRPDDDDETKWMILAFYPQDDGQTVVLRCAPYDQVYDHCMFSLLIWNPQANSMWGRPAAAGLSHLQKFTDATFSQGADAVTVNILPTLVVPPGSDFARKKFKFSPLGLITGNVNEIGPVNIGSGSLAAVGASFGQLETVRQYGERLSHVSDATTRGDDKQRTKFEVNILFQEGEQAASDQVGIFEIGMSDGDGLAGFATKLWKLFQKNMPQDRPVAFKVKKGGRNDWPEALPEWFRGKYTFHLHGASKQGSAEVRLRRAEATLQLLIMSPVNQYSLGDTVETAITKTQRLVRVYRDITLAMGYKDPEELIGSEPESLEECLPIIVGMAPQVAAKVVQEELAKQGIFPAPVPVGPTEIPGQNPGGGVSPQGGGGASATGSGGVQGMGPVMPPGGQGGPV